MVAFVGLDLAWTAHHETGVCVLEQTGESVVLRELHCSVSSPEAFAAVCEWFGEDVVVAVDAPLVVEPERRAEAELGRVYGAKHAGAYSANMPFLTTMNGLAGPNLAKQLEEGGFELDPGKLTAQAHGRFALEVFPHPAHVELFELPMALKYKKGRVACRKSALRHYQVHLAEFLSGELPLVLGAPPVRQVLDAEALAAKGKALKNLEDRLDALTCAYIAYHCWRHGQVGFRIFGCGAHGSIVVPVRVP
ncbi:MAG: DUF429 domain-containing protein [Anaerolineaceae bacterium]